MREKLLRIGDDFWIEDEPATRSTRSTARPSGCGRRSSWRTRRRRAGEDPGTKLSVRDKMKIEWGGRQGDGAQGHARHPRPLHHRGDGENLHAHGNFVDHEYEIERDGETIATISKKWFRVRDTYGVEIGAGENGPSSWPSPCASTRWPAAERPRTAAPDVPAPKNRRGGFDVRPAGGSDLQRHRRSWSGWRDLNPRPLRPERSALPSCATPRCSAAKHSRRGLSAAQTGNRGLPLGRQAAARDQGEQGGLRAGRRSGPGRSGWCRSPAETCR